MTRCVVLFLTMCAGCQSLGPRPPALGDRLTAVGAPQAPVAKEASSPGTEPAGPGVNAESASRTPEADEHLNRAVALLEKGQDAAALPHLERYVADRPDQLIARANLGELLFRQKKLSESRLQFELFVALAQEQGDAAFRYLIHSHSRLVEIAEEQAEVFEEHLNRGIGLYLLACKRATEPDPNGDCSVDSLLCRAAEELHDARSEQPQEARTHFYLYQIYSRLGQQSAAREALTAADAYTLLSRLTPLERRQLQTACLQDAERLPGRK
jgi:predicted Zn-dependent protease